MTLININWLLYFKQNFLNLQIPILLPFVLMYMYNVKYIIDLHYIYLYIFNCINRFLSFKSVLLTYLINERWSNNGTSITFI